MFSRFFEVARRSTPHRFSRPAAITGLTTGFLISAYFSIKNTAKAEIEDHTNHLPLLINLLNYLPDSDVTIESEHTAALSSAETLVFRGDLEAFMHADINGIQRVEISEKRLSSGAYNLLKPLELTNFLRFLNKQETITELCFAGCTIDSRAAMIIGDRLQSNKTLQRLEITVNEVSPRGMVYLLDALQHNHSLRTLHLKSYCNAQSYYWDLDGLHTLAKLALQHPTLKKIELPNHQLHDFCDLQDFLTAYRDKTDRLHRATITGLYINHNCPLPPICEENIEMLEEMTSSRRFRLN